MAKKRTATKKKSPPSRVWVQFDRNHFPLGVTKLKSEAKEWSDQAVWGEYMHEYSRVPGGKVPPGEDHG